MPSTASQIAVKALKEIGLVKNKIRVGLSKISSRILTDFCSGGKDMEINYSYNILKSTIRARTARQERLIRCTKHVEVLSLSYAMLWEIPLLIQSVICNVTY